MLRRLVAYVSTNKLRGSTKSSKLSSSDGYSSTQNASSNIRSGSSEWSDLKMNEDPRENSLVNAAAAAAAREDVGRQNGTPYR